MIIILTATPGCGKTNYAVWSHIKPAVENDRIVYVCGIPDLKLMHIKLSIAKLNTWAVRTPIDPEEPEGKQKLNNITEGSLIVVDEAAYPWPAIDLKDPPEYIKYLSQHRKHGLDFLVITQSPKFVHPFVLENADRHIHLSQEWSGNKQYEWSEYCANPKLKTNRQNAVKKPYKLEKKAFELYYSASLHVEKPKRAIPKMVYAAIFLLFAVPAMAMITYGRITDRLTDPMQEIASIEEEKNNKSKQGDDTPPESVIPVSQPVIALPSTKESLSMLSDAVDWAQVAACVSSKSNCICYGHQAQRLNIVPDTCNAAINYGWIVTNKL
ncbi:zonular occludens toxin domain-containing protein [Nitrosomonas ureae]|uniref:Zona occludens toxin n=1 Tax=Nitrosomonas ureae TaxID=44577 RepID=A0A1H9GRP0_9PROT|nr:zonular occludens toxin domain-containing protein [Nitrosomonas ureae]SEQ52724.1 zona occludens toxin [Nitrosomonas ureae]